MTYLQARRADTSHAGVRQALDVGEFTSDYSGAKGESEYYAQWSKTGESIIAHQYFSNPAGKFRATVMTGWDAANKSILTCAFIDNGDSLEIRYSEITDRAWKGRVKGTYGGESIEGPAENRWGSDSFEFESNTGNKTYKAVFNRRAAEKMPSEARQTIEDKLIGTFSGKGTFDGQEFAAKHEFRWDSTRSSILVQSRETDSSGVRTTNGIIGWSPLERALIHVGFSDQGNQFTISWTEFTPTTWTGRISGTYNGENFANALTKVVFGQDSLTYEDLTAGKPWKETFTRQTSK